MLKESLIDTYKRHIPPIIDKLGIYDRVINKNKYKHKLVTPMYHRVIRSDDEDPLKMGMCVREDSFENQLAYYSNNFTSIGLSSYVLNKNIHNKNESYITLTFDDGYKDNILQVKPLLEKYNLNATFFICCSILTDNKEFWWDKLINAFAKCDETTLDLLPFQSVLQISELVISDSNRRESCIKLLSALWLIPDVYLIDDICNYVEETLIDYKFTIDKLTEADIKDLYDSGFEIGAHTLTHPNLKIISNQQQNDELKRSKTMLEDITGNKINGFAYPAGYQTSDLENLVKNSGYRYAVSTINGINHTLKPFSIERFGLPETNLADIKRCISNYCKA